MTRFFRHQRREAWGVGRLVADEGDRLRLLFEDGKERVLLASVAGLVEVEAKEVDPKVRSAKLPPNVAKVKTPLLIKSVRLAIRDALDALKNEGAYPDDTLVDMQKGLSRITADFARFARTQAATVRKASAKEARALHEDFEIATLVDALADRFDADYEVYQGRTRAYEDTAEAEEALEKILDLVQRAPKLDDDEIEELQELLTPADLKSYPE